MHKKIVFAVNCVLVLLMIASASTRSTYALPGGSSKVALVPNQNGLAGNGGFLVTSGFPGGFSPTFTNLNPVNIRDDSSDPIVAGGFDTVVLVQVYNIQNWLSNPVFKSRIDNFVFNGGKLIIWDSECTANDYSLFIHPFTASTPGAMGSPNGQVWIVENNTLSTNDTASSSYVKTGVISGGWDIGDANVMVTFDPDWCTDMVCRNFLGTTGPLQTYARYGNGLIIWNGLDMDYMGGVVANDNNGGHNLNYIWYLQLKQQWNPDNLPCGVHTAGITVTPQASTNPVGAIHTVTATVRDNLANPISGVVVNFTIFSGPNAGTKGEDTTDVNGEAHFSWTSMVAGTDCVNATANCPFKPVVIYDDKATKTWVLPPARPLKEDAIAELVAAKLLTANKITLGEIDKAVMYIQNSLNPSLWVDDSHLNPNNPNGQLVFEYEVQAVQQLTAILGGQESTAVKTAIQAVICKLLKADETLAATAIGDAKALGSTNPTVILWITYAQQYFSRAEQSSDPLSAIILFKTAWLDAERAIRVAR